MMKKTAKSEWLIFASIVLKDHTDIQVKEMQKAFYAGIYSAITILVVTPDDLSDEERRMSIANIIDELQAFAEQVKRDNK